MNIFNDQIINYIDNYKTDIKDKKKRGSVFTNSLIIYDMVNLLPCNVWTNVNLKWLDAGSGIGNYMVIVFLKLYENIPIKNKEKRIKHILENMLYFVELDEKYINEYCVGCP